MLKDFQPRIYQQTILSSASEKNTLVVLPTGLGKTYIFLMLSALRLKKHPESKILLLGPTRPLITQYYELFLKHFEIEKERMAIFTGMVKPSEREKLWKISSIIFSTPQGLENDIITNRIHLEEVSLIGFDEAHRAVGDYPYVWIAKQYLKKSKNQRIIGMTASPGSDIEKINEVCSNLAIENIEIRTDNDPDVKPYIQEVKIKWVYVEFPEHFKQLYNYLKACFTSKIKNLDIKNYDTKKDLLAYQSELLSKVSTKDPNVMRSLSVLTEAIKVQHAIELLETQGLVPLLEFMESIISQSYSTKVLAVKNLAQDLNFKSALVIARNLNELRIEHPKIGELRKIVEDYTKKGKKVLVFSQYRDSIFNLVNEIKKCPYARVSMFVGQQKKKGIGLTQKEQLSIIKEFREDRYNVLVMSSVGEEGLDIPSVDAVVFYEPIPSAIRTIQRRGRTGRHEKGEVIVLVTKGTMDEAFRWVSFRKEKNMYAVLEQLKKGFVSQNSYKEFSLPEQGITIIADYREKASGIVKKLIELGISIKMEYLEVGDYILSNDLCVELKTIPDFIESIIDKRIFSQVENLKKYKKNIVILQGTEDLYSQRNLHQNAVRGAIASICVDYGIPLIQTKDEHETALMLATIAKREQTEKVEDFTLHSAKPLTLKEQQEYIISSLPNVGAVLSKPLLRRFGSVKNVINASKEELKEVDLIGEKKASKIKEVVESPYSDS